MVCALEADFERVVRNFRNRTKVLISARTPNNLGITTARYNFGLNAQITWELLATPQRGISGNWLGEPSFRRGGGENAAKKGRQVGKVDT
jgi:hypothetical protein